jgi:Lipocalin-like domain
MKFLNVFKQSLRALTLFALLLGAMSSCEKDEKLTRDISGEWEIRSFTADGVEIMGSLVRSSKFEFEKDGDFEWTISYTDGSTDIASGEYEIDAEDQEIRLESDNGDIDKMDFDLDGDDLELSGIFEQNRVVIKARKD